MIWCFALLVSLIYHVCASHLQDSQSELYQSIFGQPSAKWLQTFPICDELPDNSDATLHDYLLMKNSSLFNVELLIYFNHLVGLDEKQQSVTAKFSFVLKWKDCRLKWNPEQYAGIGSIVMSASDADIFIPKLSLEERLDSDINWSNAAVKIQSDGSVTLQKSDSLIFGCDVDVSMYPFDSQQCTVTFRSRTYPLRKLNISAIDVNTAGNVGHLDSYTPSDTWSLLDNSCESYPYYLEVDIGENGVTRGTRNKSSDIKIQEAFAQVIYRFTLQRHPINEVLNLLLPAVVTVLISGCVFFMPPGSSDKVALSLTILLGMYVFTQFMYNKMPESGSKLPLLSVYFLICVGMICGSCILAVFTVNMGQRRETCMHPLVHRLFLCWIGPRIRPELFRSGSDRRAHRVHLIANLYHLLYIRRCDRVSSSMFERSRSSSSSTLAQARVRKNEYSAKGVHVHEDVDMRNVAEFMQNEWLLLAQVCDRLFLIAHLSVTLLLFFIFSTAGIVHILL